MKAVLSGRARVALVTDGSRQGAIHFDESRTIRNISSGDAEAIIVDAPDLEFIEFEDHKVLHERLIASNASSESLDLTLFLLDDNLTEETRSCAADELDSHLAMPAIRKYLQNILFSACLPQSADVAGALRLSEGFELSHCFIKQLNDLQRWIAHVRNAWNQVPLEKGNTSQSRRAIEGLFLRSGVFSETVIALSEARSVNPIQIKFSVDPSLKKSLPRVAQILNTWMTPLRRLIQKPRSADRAVQSLEEPDYSFEDVNGSAPIHVKASDALDAALAQVQRIADLARDGKDSQAMQILEELIEAQLKHPNGAVHLVKSLCNIATKATQGARDDFAAHCLFRALNIDSTDARAYFQLANYLRDVAKYDLACRAYEKAFDYTPHGDWQSLNRIRSAKAHIFTEQGKYDEALAEYAEIPCDTHDIGIRTAIADVNRKKGDFSKAMQAYLELISEFPWHHRAFAGKAEIAKRRGDPHRAIRLYNHIFNDDSFDLDVDSRTVYTLAKGHLFKIVGQYDKALAFVNEVIREQPYNLRATLQMASILALSQSANAGYDHISPQKVHVDDWRLHYFRGLTMFRMNRITEAKRELLEKMDLTQLLPEDLPLAKSAQAFVYLAEQDTESAKSILRDVRPFDRHLKDLQQVFQTHVNVLNDPSEDTQIYYPRLKRSMPDLRHAVDGLRRRDLKFVILSELTCLLRAA